MIKYWTWMGCGAVTAFIGVYFDKGDFETSLLTLICFLIAETTLTRDSE